jgi:hypothetical protein
MMTLAAPPLSVMAAVTFGYAASVTGAAVSVVVGDGPICATSACAIAAMPNHAASLVGALCMPSFIYPYADATVTTDGPPLVGSWPSQCHSRSA